MTEEALTPEDIFRYSLDTESIVELLGWKKQVRIRIDEKINNIVDFFHLIFYFVK